MKFSRRILFAATAAVTAFLAPAATAVPTGAKPTSEAAEAVLIPFDPPVGHKLRYRMEKTTVKDGVSTMVWSVSDMRFEPNGNGFRLIVEPVTAGTGDERPLVVAVYKKLEELMQRPYTIVLSPEGEIVALEDEQVYWEAIFDAFEELLSGSDIEGKPIAEPVKAAVMGIMASMRNMPDEARLAMLTENVQPLVEFVATEWTLAEPVSATVESPSPLGGTVNREVNLVLDGISGGMASFSLHSTIPPAELKALAERMLVQLGSHVPANSDQAKMRDEIAKLEDFRHESRARYRVSLADGMLQRFESNERVSVSEDGKSNDKETSVTIQRID